MSEKTSVLHMIPTKRRADHVELAGAGREAFRAAGLSSVVRGLTALKSHFGEKGGSGFVPPAAIRAIVDEVRAAGGNPFLTDTTTLYTGMRTNAVDYMRLVHDHGFTMEAVGAPFLVADGLVGASETEIEIPGVHHQKVAIATDAIRAGSAIVVSHATGHLAAGLGATIKNVGMGLASRRGKLRQHSSTKPSVDRESCSGCGECETNCPTGAIRVLEKGRGRSARDVASIDREVCSGCGECLASCREDAIRYDWKAGSRRLQERMAEHALGFVKRLAGRIGYVTFVTNVTPNCDCMGRKEAPLFDDIGVLSGLDPVAIDQAVLDLIRERTGATLESVSYPNLDAAHQLAHAERIGLGTREYRIVTGL